MPPSMRCAYKCNKAATGEVNRWKINFGKIFISILKGHGGHGGWAERAVL